MPQLTDYGQAEIDSWDVGEQGVRDGTSPTIVFDREGAVATRKIICNWDTRLDTVRYFLGDTSTYLDGGGVMRLSRLLPQRLPDKPKFIAVKLAEPITGHQSEGMEDEDGDVTPAPVGTSPRVTWRESTVNRYTRAKLVIQYERVPFDVDFDANTANEIERYVQYLPGESNADYLTRPAATQVYKTPDGSPPHDIPVPFATGVVDPTHRFRLAWHRIPGDGFGPEAASGTPSPLWLRIFGDDSNPPWLGAINKSRFRGHRAGTVLLEAVAITYAPNVLGDDRMEWGIEYGFAVKSIGGWHTSWYFPNTTQALAGGRPKKYEVGASTVYYAVADIPDQDGNYNVRDFADPDHGLFSLG